MSGSFAPLSFGEFKAPDLIGMANARQTQSLNAMREDQLLQQSGQLRAAESERNALRQYLSDPNVDIMSPDTARRVLSIAPTIGGPALNAAVSARREAAQTQTAGHENAIKLTQSFRDLLPTATPENYPALRAAALAAVPGWAPSWPVTYDADAVRALMQKADDKLKEYGVTVTASPAGGFVAAPPVVPRGAAPLQGPQYISPENIPTAPPPGAPAPRAAAPGLTPGQTQAAAFLRQREGFRDTPYYDVNAYRGGFGSDQTTRADGTVVPVQQGMAISREDAERDLARRIPQFEQRVVAAVGQEQYAALPPNAQAALISIAYNYGTLPGSIRAAARSGDPAALAQAVAGLAGDNQGVNAGRRRAEAAMIAGGNAMAPNAAPANAMLAPPDAAVVPRPLSPVEFPGAPRPASLSEADLLKRIRDVQQKEAEALMLEQVRRETAASRAVEEGEKAGSIRRGQLTAEQEREDRRKQEGREKIEQALEDMKTSYQRLEELSGIPSERRGAAANIPAYLSATAPGQEISKALATPSQSQRNALQASGRQLLTAIKAATNMSAQEMNSNVELQQLMAAISSPTQSIESVREILLRISRNYGAGRLEFGAPAPAAAAPRDGVPSQRRGAAAPAQGQYQEGQTATGPNGQRVIFRGGQWVPVQ